MDTKMANELIPVTDLGWGVSPVLVATATATIALFTLVWALHVKMRDAGVVDFFWGVGFALNAWLAIWLRGEASILTLAVAALVTLWAARLTVHMVWRHRHMGGEDARYAAMRAAGGPGWWWRSLFTLYWLQAVVLWTLAAPLHALALGPAAEPPLLLVVLGLALFAAGLAVETVADRQLWRFKADPRNRGRLMTEGLFAWSRHPNYFGETVLWWGIGLLALAGSGQWWALAGPALLTFLLLKVSGVGMLDAHLARTKPGYEAWAARTPAFVPRRPRAESPALGRTRG